MISALLGLSTRSLAMIPVAECLAGRTTAIPDAPVAGTKHFTLGTELFPPWPAGLEVAIFGMGCFWCSEGLFLHRVSKDDGIYSTQVGYIGGDTPNPTYKEVCTGRTNHAEVVRIIYDPKKLPYRTLLKYFYEGHDPTTLNRQGGDVGTMYRSHIFTTNPAQAEDTAKATSIYQSALRAAGRGDIVTRVSAIRADAPPNATNEVFYYAEDYHQQYDAKPGSRQYCGLIPTGVRMPEPSAPAQ